MLLSWLLLLLLLLLLLSLLQLLLLLLSMLPLLLLLPLLLSLFPLLLLLPPMPFTTDLSASRGEFTAPDEPLLPVMLLLLTPWLLLGRAAAPNVGDPSASFPLLLLSVALNWPCINCSACC